MKKFVIILFGFIFVILISSFILISGSKNKLNKTVLDKTANTKEETTKKEIFNENYLEYSEENFEKNKGKKKVLFFSAVWCPTCTLANSDIREQINDIPEDLVILKVDYDTQTELKEKYGITYQHTFVYVDDEGNEILKWNGGALKEIIEKTK